MADMMILVASMAGLCTVARFWVVNVWAGPIPTGIQAAITSASVFLSLGGLGACVARWRGRARFEGFCWGVICGPFGLLMFALMPMPRED